jgi:hypothetical protein
MQRAGENVTPIAKLMQRVGSAMQQGSWAEAEKIADEALKLLGSKEK